VVELLDVKTGADGRYVVWIESDLKEGDMVVLNVSTHRPSSGSD
jgi:hypothetical protein